MSNTDDDHIDPWDPSSSYNTRNGSEDTLEEATQNLNKAQAYMKKMKKLVCVYV
jgi:hypothetical protein